MKTILEARKIQKYFRKPVEYHVLKDLSFKVDQGEFVSIMGKSGCGKSTLLYILSTMDTTYEGELYFNNELITGKKRDYLAFIRNKYIGFVFQFHYLLSEFSVLDNVMLPAKKLNALSQKDIKDRAMNKLQILGIEKLALKRASQISGGEKQRVAIARALINDPLLIMGDEPTGNLDSHNSLNVYTIFKELSKNQGLSLLVVTHDEDFAAKTDRVIKMEDGRIIDQPE